MVSFSNVSIDLDGLGCYHQIHRLDVEPDPAAIYRDAMPRFLELFDELRVRATFFVIASDLRLPDAVAALSEAVTLGHECASHTYHHPYNLREWNERSIRREIAQATDAIADTLGKRPIGFRTPGYNVDTTILRVLAETGYRYDSSVFPSPPYYAAKGAVMAAMALFGRPSGSSMTHPSALRAPLQPSRPSRWDFSRRGDRKHSLPLWEIPIGVLPGARVPVIGTSVGALSPASARRLVRWFKVGQGSLQFEMHGIDLLDSSDDCIRPELAARQPDVRRDWRSKRDAFAAFIRAASEHAPFMTLAEATDMLDAEAGPTVVGTRMEDYA
jgi:hypothetical protein